ncbi:MAG: NACHT domain-containing protein [Oscillatoriophycideae cyanobacterium NC_groundwater_1537_Pr4_S-0.65um_50_18]|nr:NACHT domain-containing protein [Oscillatoriophycideae cyanobacterium NC_groundwater_1537_Pr4_S-0.65um_50_18]
MDVEQAIDFADALIFAASGVHLSDLQQAMLRASWSTQRQSYEQIATSHGYSDTYLKHDVGPKLWRSLSVALGEKVNKKNFRAAIERRYRAEIPSQPAAPPSTPAPSAIAPQLRPDQPRQDQLRQDWEEAIDLSFFYGRQTELMQLQQWLQVNTDSASPQSPSPKPSPRCRLIALLGMGGMGKTALAARLAQTAVSQTGDAPFQLMIWRSLRNPPALSALLQELVSFLSNQQEAEATVSRLLYWLRTQRCLVILDNVESILQSGEASGYRLGYEAYGELLRQVGETVHSSCLILTSREKPPEIALLEGEAMPVRSLRLGGLGWAEGQAVINLKGSFQGSMADWETLVTGYLGNPLALKMIATTIQTLFDGNIAEFLKQKTFVFGNIQHLIGQQFDRLSTIEKTVMYWLAIYREPASFVELRADIFPPIAPQKLIETLEFLEQRSLIEKVKLPESVTVLFSLQPVVMEYMGDRLVEQIFQILQTGEWLAPIQNCLLKSHALLKTQAKDYIRETQIRLIVQPVLDRLLLKMGSESLAPFLLNQLEQLRGKPALEVGYAGGNILNLLCQRQICLHHHDFSHLILWQAYLQEVSLQDVNFAYSDLSHALFADTLGMIFAVALSPDGTLLAIGDAEGGLRLWQVSDGKLVLRLEGHSGWVWAVAFSGEGQTLASCSSDKTIRIWSVSTGDCLQVLHGHTGSVWSVAFSPDGSMLASGGDESSLLLWDRATGTCIHRLQGHQGRILSVAFSPDGSMLASGSADGTIRLWQVASKDCCATLSEHSDYVWSVAFSPDGHHLASGSADRTLKLWLWETGACVQTLQHDNRVRSVQFSPDGETLISGSDDQTLRLWQVETGTCINVLRGHTDSVFSIAAADQTLVSGSADQTVKLWNAATGRCFRTLKGDTNSVFSVAFSPEGQLLASSSTDQTIRLWSWRDGTCLQTLRSHTGWVTSVAFHPEGNLLASSSADQTIRLWDVATGQNLRVLRGHTHWVQSVSFSPDGLTLASGGDDRTVRLWDVATGRCLKTLVGHTSWIWAVAFAPQLKTAKASSELIASSSDDRTIRLWSVNSEACLHLLKGHQGQIQTIAFSPDGQLLASGSSDETIRLWSVETGDCLRVLSGHTNNIWSVAFSPDGALLGSRSLDQTVRLWSIETGACVKSLPVVARSVRSAIAFSPSEGADYTLAAGSHSGDIQIWHPLTGECCQTLTPDRLYQRTVISQVTGLTIAQKEALKALGAIEE